MNTLGKIFFLSSMILFLSFNSNRSFGQCGPLTTPFFTNNGQDGVMFDIVAVQSVNITQFAMDFDTGIHTIEIYGKSGTHVGFENNAAAWTLLGTATGWSATANTNVLIPIIFSKFLCAGDVAAFYVTSTTPVCNYSNGTAVGNNLAVDANIRILQGTGKDYPFLASFTPRNPNVTAYYSCATSCCLPPTMTFTAETCVGSCNGTATATVGAGGVGPYTYLWNAAAGNQTTQTATGLCAGTYSVNVTDNTGCVSTNTVTVTSGGAVANATITPSGPYCDSDPAVILSAVTPGGTWSGTGITNTATGAFDPSIAGSGTHIITYTILGPCGATQSTNIVVNTSYDATITPVGPFCDSDPSILLTAADLGGTWTGTGITNAATGAFDPTAAGAGTHTVTYTISGVCGDVQTLNIIVSSAMDATITPVGPYCDSDPAITLNAVDAGGTWTGAGITNAATGTFDPGLAGAGTHTITYSIPGSCGDVQTTDITVNPSYDATITPVGPFCSSDAALTLVAADAGGIWSGNGITNAATGDFDPTLAGVGTHTITYTISGLCGDVQTLNIVITANFDASITPIGPYCQLDSPIVLSAVNTGGTWTGVGITNAVTGTFDPGVAGAGTHTITYSILGACGDVQTTDIIVTSALNASITPVGPFCQTDPIVLLVGADAGGTWSGNGITNTVTGEFDPTLAGAGSHTITYTIPGSCGDIQTSTIVVTSNLNASIMAVGPFCQTDPSIVLTSVDPGGSWSGTGITNSTAGTFDPSVAAAGTHTITYTIGGSCGDVQTVDILVNSIDDATISPVGPLCLGSPILTLVGVTSGGTWSGNGITNTANGYFDPTVAGPGIHTITYSTNGPCPDVFSMDIEVLDLLVVQAMNDITICEGQSINLTATGSGGDGNLNYTWTDQGGNNVGIGNLISVSPSFTTTYSVSVTDGCTTPLSSDNSIVTVTPLPIINFVVDVNTGCAPLDVTFTNISGSAGTDCVWDLGNGATSLNSGNVSAQYIQEGCYDVTLTVMQNGCLNSQTVQDIVCVAEEPVAQFLVSPDQTDVFDTEFEFTNLSSNADIYEWDFGDNTLSTEENPIYEYDDIPGGYIVCLTASNSYGCVDTFCAQINILEPLIYYVPNTFTPDGNEFNQFFQPIFTSGFDPFNFNFTIYNRWGELIWETNNDQIGWDGTGANGKLVQSGTYIWRVVLKAKENDDRFIDSGHVNVLR